MKSKKIFTLSAIILPLIFNITYAEESCSIDELNTAEGYRLYECRVENVCEKEYFSKINNRINFDTNTSDNSYPFEIEGFGIEIAKEKYRNNMNSIYKCSILKVQKESLLLIKDKLLSIDSKGSIKEKIDRKIGLELTKLDIKTNESGCINTKSTTIQNKYNVLNHATYELCRYHSYLEYLKEYNSDINNTIIANSPENETKEEKDKKRYSVNAISSIVNGIQIEIDNEIEHSYKMFPLAYHAYSEYENNYSIHVLLELIKEDYMVLRKKLYSALNPINQVVYKIANAMSLD